MAQLLDGFDTTGELSSEQLAATQIVYTTDPARKNNLCTRKAPNQLLEALSSSDRSLFLVSLSV